MNKTIVIFGATCESGIELCRLFRDDQDRIIAPVRAGSDRAKLTALGVDIRAVDALHREQVLDLVDDVEPGAIFISLLGRQLTKKTGVDIDGNINAIDAAVKAKAGRFILISSVGAGASAGAMGIMNKLIVGRLVKEKSIAEEHLIKQRIPWSIIRPGALIRIKKPTGEAFLTENPLTIGAVNRTDLGGLIHKVALAEQAVQKIYNALDRSDGKVVAGQGELAPVQL